MTGSRVNAFLSAVLLCLGPLAAAAAESEKAGPATAPPRGLAPPDQLPGEGEALPTDDGQPALQEPAEETLPDQPGKPSGPRVTVTDLGRIDPAGAGLINASSGGFAPNVWSGSPRAPVAARVAQLPAAPTSPAMQGLMRRLLLTGAPPPVGATPPDEPSFLAQRLAKIIASGWLEEGAMLSAQSARDDVFARRAGAEALLLQGREDDACGDATSLRESSNDDYWLKLRVLCYLLQSNTPAANLTLEVMRERGIEDDAFFALARAAGEGASPEQAPALESPTGIHLALLRRVNQEPPAALVGWVPAAPLLTRSSDPEVRLAALEKSAAAGLVSADRLRAAYEAETFTVDQLDDPEEHAAKLSTARGNALYFQTISKRTFPAARAAAFAAALQRADAQNRFALFARVSDDVALGIKPAPDTAWLAPHIARVLLYAGRDKAVEAWMKTLTSPTDGPTVNAIQIHLALVRPTTENDARLQGAMTWLGQNALKAGGAKVWLMERATREIPLLDALGYVVPPDAQWAVSATTAGIVPSGAAAEAMIAVARTARQGRIGETVLNALVALGPPGPARAQGQTVARVVEALSIVGLRDEARTVAIEAALASPLRLRK